MPEDLRSAWLGLIEATSNVGDGADWAKIRLEAHKVAHPSFLGIASSLDGRRGKALKR